jgi:hypothetical protein
MYKSHFPRVNLSHLRSLPVTEYTLDNHIQDEEQEYGWWYLNNLDGTKNSRQLYYKNGKKPKEIDIYDHIVLPFDQVYPVSNLVIHKEDDRYNSRFEVLNVQGEVSWGLVTYYEPIPTAFRWDGSPYKLEHPTSYEYFEERRTTKNFYLAIYEEQTKESKQEYGRFVQAYKFSPEYFHKPVGKSILKRRKWPIGVPYILVENNFPDEIIKRITELLGTNYYIGDFDGTPKPEKTLTELRTGVYNWLRGLPDEDTYECKSSRTGYFQEYLQPYGVLHSTFKNESKYYSESDFKN